MEGGKTPKAVMNTKEILQKENQPEKKTITPDIETRMEQMYQQIKKLKQNYNTLNNNAVTTDDLAIFVKSIRDESGPGVINKQVFNDLRTEIDGLATIEDIDALKNAERLERDGIDARNVEQRTLDAIIAIRPAPNQDILVGPSQTLVASRSSSGLRSSIVNFKKAKNYIEITGSNVLAFVNTSVSGPEEISPKDYRFVIEMKKNSQSTELNMDFKNITAFVKKSGFLRRKYSCSIRPSSDGNQLFANVTLSSHGNFVLKVEYNSTVLQRKHFTLNKRKKFQLVI